MDDRNLRLPVPAKAALPSRRPALQPALWQQAAPVVVRGAALVAAGLIGEWLLRSFARNAFSSPRTGRKTPQKRTSLVPARADSLPEGTVAISETVVMHRVIFRR